MSYAVDIVTVTPTTLASVRARVAWKDLSTAIPRMLDPVWKFLRAGGAPVAGHDVCLYHSPGPDGVDLEAGVQVAAAFAPRDGIACSATPGGRSHTVHRGPDSKVGGAHDALGAFAKAQNDTTNGLHWEVYGDWSDDPATLVTDVYRLLA